MAKQKIRRLLAFCLAVSMLMGTTAMAVDGTEYIENDDGTVTQQITETTPSTNEGTPTITLKVEQKIDETTDNMTNDGVKVDRDSITVDTYVADENGQPIVDQQLAHYEDGTEIREGKGYTDGLPELSVTLKPGQSGSDKADDSDLEAPIVKTEGDVPADENDKTYDYTKTTVESVDRVLNASISKETVKTDVVKTDMDSIQNENYEGKYNDKDLFKPNYNASGDVSGMEQPAPDGYDYQLVGYGDATTMKKVERDYIVYVKDADGNPIKDADGNYVIDTTKTKYNKIDNSPMNMALEKDGEYFYAYCVDADTSTADGAWYTIANLEDNTYYPDQESADKIRAIVNNGYWGTAPYETNEDGTVVTDEEGNPVTKKGSLAKIKESLKAYYDEDDTVQVQVDTKGTMKEYTVFELLDSLTESEALAATQAAIWTYANGGPNTADGKDGYVVDGPISTYKGGSFHADYEMPGTYGHLFESDARMQAMYEWLLAQEGKKADSVVINEKNFIENFGLTVGDQVADAEANKDDNKDNDVYNVDFSFTMVVEPSTQNGDDMIVKLYKDGEVIRTARLAGDASEDGDEFSTLTKNGNTYTFTDLELAEGSGMMFDLKLEGVQNLQEGVYIYTSHATSDYEKSQTLVGIASGKREVEITSSVEIEFSVDENSDIHTERYWHDEWSELGDDDDDDDDIIPGDDDDDDDDDIPGDDDDDDDDDIPGDDDDDDDDDTPKGDDDDDDDDIIPGDDDDDDDDTPKGDDDDDDDDDTDIGDDDVPQGEFPGDDDDDDNDNIPEEDVPLVEMPEEDVPLEELPEDDVPLAEVPKTGDASIIWFALSALSGAGLMGLNLTKKREDEE